MHGDLRVPEHGRDERERMRGLSRKVAIGTRREDDATEGRCRTRRVVPKPCAEVLEHPNDNRREQRVLGREVPIERAWCVVGEFRDALHGEGVEALTEYDVGGRLDDSLQVGAVSAVTWRLRRFVMHVQIVNDVYSLCKSVQRRPGDQRLTRPTTPRRRRRRGGAGTER